jgi:hypothetical protein
MTIPEAAGKGHYDESDSDYGFHFTDKDPRDIRRLNNYELQHAIYHYHKMVDSGEDDKVTDGKAMLKNVFEELDRRGMTGIRPAAAR